MDLEIYDNTKDGVPAEQVELVKKSFKLCRKVHRFSR